MIIDITEVPTVLHDVCFLQFFEGVRYSRNRYADDIGDFSDGKFFVPAEKIADFKPGRITDHIKFLGAPHKRLVILKLLFDLLNISLLHAYSNDNEKIKKLQANLSTDLVRPVSDH